MKKNITFILFIATLIFISTPTFAKSLKEITLKDGSVLKGHVVQLRDGIYTIKTSNIGEIEINEDDILNISSSEAAAKKKQMQRSSKTLNPTMGIKKMQENLMADPNIMSGVQSMLEDDEIKALLSDPKLINDVMSFDPEKIGQNENVNKLLQHPDMQRLMHQAQDKFVQPEK